MKMLAQLSDSGIEDVDVRIEVFPDLQMRVDVHAKAEERTLYHALREEDDTKELALEAIEHHRVARVLMVELRNIRVDDELWLPKMRMIKKRPRGALHLRRGGHHTCGHGRGRKFHGRMGDQVHGHRERTIEEHTLKMRWSHPRPFDLKCQGPSSEDIPYR